jgi:hypothetical protein
MVLLCSTALLQAAEPNSTGEVDFTRDIEPILQKRCYECHGPEKHKNGLRLDLKSAALQGGDSGKAIVPGNSSASLLVERVTTLDEDEVMPPKGEKLSSDQIALLKRWIDRGAPWPERADSPDTVKRGHWSFQPPLRTTLPGIKNSQWVQNPIDQFIMARLEREGVTPSPETDRRTLIRRLSLDLLGLPPTPEDVRTFVNDTRANAYEQLVDRLLASPHFGERWARHWLDLARYADSDGYEKDAVRPYAYLFRDWVIRAMNSDMPFDQFTIEQIAGDLLPNPALSQQIATGFQRQTLTNKEGGVDQEEYRCKATVDRTSTVGTVWLGLTLGCAECHSHKYDPISQREFYQFYAFFNDANEKDMPAPQPKELAEYSSAKGTWDTELKALRAKLSAHLDSDLTVAQTEWERRSPGSTTVWQVLHPGSVQAAEGTTLTVDSNSVVNASEKSPATDTYTIEIDSAPVHMTGLRLEALKGDADKVGRAQKGNFVLSELRLKSINARGESRALPLTNAIADFSQEDYEVRRSIDGDPKTGWAVSPRTSEAHVAAFELVEPLDAESRLSLSLVQQFGKQFAMARFRLSITTSAPPFTADVIPASVAAALKMASAERSPEQKAAIARYYREEVDSGTLAIKKEIAAQVRKEPKFPETKAAILAVADPQRKTQIHVRGDFLRKGDEVEPATLSVLPPLKSRGEKPDRLDLANWLIDRSSPLTARVAVNHVWKHLLGRGLVSTVDDFGTRGEKPSHPELLDWLAIMFSSKDGSGLGWSRKALIRLIVTSTAYRQSSVPRGDLLERDPTNILLARQNRLRLEAEPIRDAHLFASGLFMPVLGGPSVRPPLPGDIAAVGYANQIRWKESAGPDRYRRGLYTFFQRTVPYPMLITFDAPDSNVACTRRERSNTPLQALTLLNDPVFFECAQTLGRRLASPVLTPRQRVMRAFETCLSREPTEEETARLEDLYLGYVQLCEAKPENAAKMAGVPAESPNVAQTAAAVMLVRTTMNLDEFVSRD